MIERKSSKWIFFFLLLFCGYMALHLLGDVATTIMITTVGLQRDVPAQFALLSVSLVVAVGLIVLRQQKGFYYCVTRALAATSVLCLLLAIAVSFLTIPGWLPLLTWLCVSMAKILPVVLAWAILNEHVPFRTAVFAYPILSISAPLLANLVAGAIHNKLMLSFPAVLCILAGGLLVGMLLIYHYLIVVKQKRLETEGLQLQPVFWAALASALIGLSWTKLQSGSFWWQLALLDISPSEHSEFFGTWALYSNISNLVVGSIALCAVIAAAFWIRKRGSSALIPVSMALTALVAIGIALQLSFIDLAEPHTLLMLAPLIGTSLIGTGVVWFKVLVKELFFVSTTSLARFKWKIVLDFGLHTLISTGPLRVFVRMWVGFPSDSTLPTYACLMGVMLLTSYMSLLVMARALTKAQHPQPKH